MSSATPVVGQPSLVIAATFTAEPMALPLEGWFRWLQWPVRLRFAPYNQVFQQLLDRHSLLATNRGDTNLLLVRIEDWCPTDLADRWEIAAGRGDEFLHAVEQFSRYSSGRLLVCFCPSTAVAHPAHQQTTRLAGPPSSEPGYSPSTIDGQERMRLSLEADLLTRLSKIPGVMTIGSSAVTEHYPVDEIDDVVAQRAGHIPYSQAYFTALATLLARRLFSLSHPPTKVIALDCDQTLWDGVCGEVGPLGVRVPKSRQALQAELLRLRENGFLLCLCSKNHDQDVWSVFEQHPDMLLRREHITAAQINWSAKSDNLRALAGQLHLGLDSFLFLDDNPLECAEVRAHLPEVLTLQLPDSLANRREQELVDLVHFLRHVWALDRTSITDEDRQRAALYAQQVQRDEVRQQSKSLVQFLSELNLVVSFLPLIDERLERAAQLTERTNQFNFTTRRRTIAELKQLCGQTQQHAFMVDASDKFGDYGLVGLVLYEVLGETLLVDSFMLSCRALGRLIELQMLDELLRCARQHHCSELELRLIETEKNQPAQEFARRALGVSVCGTTDPNTHIFRLTIEQLEIALRNSHEQTTMEPVASGASGFSSGNGRVQATPSGVVGKSNWPSELCQQIATEWSTVNGVLARLRSEARPRPELDDAYSPPRTAIEQQVVELCESVLNVQRVGIHDGLKALGASSLHIVQIYSQLEQKFRAGLSITDLFALPTIATIIDTIERAGSAGSSESPRPVDETSSRRHPISGQTKSPDTRSATTEHGIAIIGMAGRFPGAANVQEFWSNITRGVCSIVEIPDEALNLPLDSPLRKNPNLVRKASSVQDADKFDAKFFGIFPKEATVMDPQHRLLLESCWHAIEDAGYNVDRLEVPVGVFAGCYMDTYMLASLSLSPKWLDSLANAFHGGDLLTELGNDKDYLATRVSFLLNLRGPAITVQTACSTSLVAISQACQSLVSGQCDMALAGGSTLKLPQNRGYLYTEGGMVSPDGVCRTFDARARGTVFGEGCGVVLLKRVEDAMADGDDIYAVIKGWGLNNDGRAKLGYTAPSVEGQSGAIAMAHRAAEINAESITLMEAHGTGTSLGDPIEIESLTRVFRQTTDKRQYCAIGSLKTNIGHLDVAAGVTGLIKTSLALRHRVLPPTLNYERPNPNIDFESSPFYVNTQLRDWTAPFPRRAGLSSFGVGGTNAHVVVEEAPQQVGTTTTSGPQLILLSARSAAALDQQRVNLLDHLQEHPQIGLADVAFTLQTGRKTFNYTLATVVRNVAEAIEVLRDKPTQKVFEARQVRRSKSVVFLFPGQGSQHVDMARDLYDTDQAFRRTVDECCELLRPHVDFDLREKIFSQAVGSPIVADEEAIHEFAHQLNQTSVAQAGIFVVSYALAKRLQADGVFPKRMIGHSVGEFVAACLAGVFSLADALRLIAFRATHMQRLPKGSMLAVRLSEKQLLPRMSNQLSLAAINGPQLSVVSGPTAQVEQLQQELEGAEVGCRILHTSHAFHSAMMDPVVEPFAEQLRCVELRPPAVPIVSSVTGVPLTAEQAIDPLYWARHLRVTVRFTDALAAVAADPDAVLLEVGPGQTLSTLARQHPSRDSEQVVLSALPHARQAASAREHLLLTLGRLWQAGVDVDWKLQFHGQRRRRLHLPVYPFERLRYWLEPEPTSAATDTESPAGEMPSEANAARSESVMSDPQCQSYDELTTYEQETGQTGAWDLEEMARRVIQKQLQLMHQQLQAWHS